MPVEAMNSAASQQSRAALQDGPSAPNVRQPEAEDRREERGEQSAGGSAFLRVDALLRVISDLVFVVSRDGVVLECHIPPGNDLLLTAENLAGQRVTDLLPAPLAELAMENIVKTTETGEAHTFFSQYFLPGRIRELEVRLAPTGRWEVLALVRDVTDRKLLEKEILDIANQEQMRIGQDLHDGLGQHLTGITFLTRALEKKLSLQGLPEAAEAAEIGQLVIQALSQTRNLARGIFPVELESTGLVPAFRELASTVEKLFNISCLVECAEPETISSRSVANHLFRLAQEAVNNSVKHGQARRVIIGLQDRDGRTELSIRDDGVGLPRDGIKMKGLGLRIMSYRAQKIGGALGIESPESGGTVVTCRFRQPTPAT